MNVPEPIALSAPTFDGNEWAYVRDCLDTGWVSSAGAWVGRFERAVADRSGRAHGVATMNGTSALHLALLAAGVQPGDLVLVSNLTFVASANVIRHVGAEPVLVDADDTSWQIDGRLVADYLTHRCERRDDALVRRTDGRRVRALMPAHILGDVGPADVLAELATAHSLVLIEDASEALGATLHGRAAGGFGRAAAFSFNGNKLLSTGGGGVIVTDDAALANRARHLSTQAKVPGQGYFHDEVGFNHRLVNVLAAIGVAQMECLAQRLAARREIAARYRTALSGTADIRLPEPVTGARGNGWLTTIHTARRDALLAALADAGIEARPLWMPMNRLPMYSGCEYVQRDDTAGRLFAGCVSLPSSAHLTESQQARVIEIVLRTCAGRAA